MKNLKEHMLESLRIGINDTPEESSWDNVEEVYGLSWYKLEKTFYIAKYEIEEIYKINNNPIRYEITGASTNYGFKDMQCRFIEEYNILYNDGPRNFILIHSEDKKRLELLFNFTNYLQSDDENHLYHILNDRLKIDFTKFIKFGVAYGHDPFEKYRCDMGNGTISDLRKDIAYTLNTY